MIKHTHEADQKNMSFAARTRFKYQKNTVSLKQVFIVGM